MERVLLVTGTGSFVGGTRILMGEGEAIALVHGPRCVPQARGLC